MKECHQDFLNVTDTLILDGRPYRYCSLRKLAVTHPQIAALPFCIRVLLENALRNCNGFSVTEAHVMHLLAWQDTQGYANIPFIPSRVLMQDFTGVPAVVDIASIRAEVGRRGGDVSRINPVVPVDLVIDHSVQVEHFGSHAAYEKNVALEYARNQERYQLLKWGQQAFDNFSVVPPGMGICHQINIEFLAQVVNERADYLFPDTLVGTDSHTPMVNSLGVLGWGVGGIEAEAAMLGQPLYMTLPKVVGLRITGTLQEGITATDLVLTITEMLRTHGVVGKFVEVFGEGVRGLTVSDRATISNMSPEFGCTDTHWPVDEGTLAYLHATGRSASHIERVRRYCKENLLWGEDTQVVPSYSEQLTLDLASIVPTIAGPRRPQDKIALSAAKEHIIGVLKSDFGCNYTPPTTPADNGAYSLRDGDVVIAAITSCTNTSNPAVMIGAGLLAKKAVQRGLSSKPWVKTSLAPGSRVVTEYLQKAELIPYLESLGFYVVGYGCTTCIGNSGDMIPAVQEAVRSRDLVVSAVLSGNRNFEARIHPLIRMNFLASPMLVVAYALTGRTDLSMHEEPLGTDKQGRAVYLKDLWPTPKELAQCMQAVLSREDYVRIYGDIFKGDDMWHRLAVPAGDTYVWEAASTYIREVPFFRDLSTVSTTTKDIERARVLLFLGDMVTTDHISPAGKFHTEHPAGVYLQEQGVKASDFNSYGARRGNHEVMIRGTFANVRIKNKLASREGGWTRYFGTGAGDGEETTVFAAAMRYEASGTPLIVIAGKEYGSGSSRDWAAKGTRLLGVQAVFAESFERIHRANLVGMGVLPIEFIDGQSASTLGLTGKEHYTISGLQTLTPNQRVDITAQGEEQAIRFQAKTRLDSAMDILYYQHGGILHYVSKKLLAEALEG